MILHVANGSATTRLIEASGLPGWTLSWADSLYDGPVPDVPDEQLVRVRAEFHASADHPLERNLSGFSEWRTTVDDHDAYDELVLWYEHDLFDQLNLIHVLSYIGRGYALARPVSLVSIDRFEGHADFKGLGQLTPPQLAALFDGRQHVTEAQIVLAKRAWRAYRAADPRALEALVRSETSPLPFLSAALHRHLEEFPSHDHGLSKSEQRILELAAGGPVSLHGAFGQVHEGERAYYLTDSSFIDRLDELAAATPSLLTLVTEGHERYGLPGGTYGLTAAGHDVRRGAADRVRLCGIDRWMGGVHLTGHGPLWRWDARRGQLVEA